MPYAHARAQALTCKAILIALDCSNLAKTVDRFIPEEDRFDFCVNKCVSIDLQTLVFSLLCKKEVKVEESASFFLFLEDPGRPHCLPQGVSSGLSFLSHSKYYPASRRQAGACISTLLCQSINRKDLDHVRNDLSIYYVKRLFLAAWLTLAV